MPRTIDASDIVSMCSLSTNLISVIEICHHVMPASLLCCLFDCGVFLFRGSRFLQQKLRRYLCMSRELHQQCNDAMHSRLLLMQCCLAVAFLVAQYTNCAAVVQTDCSFTFFECFLFIEVPCSVWGVFSYLQLLSFRLGSTLSTCSWGQRLGCEWRGQLSWLLAGVPGNKWCPGLCDCRDVWSFWIPCRLTKEANKPLLSRVSGLGTLA